jgi:predicted tellurium resistance membrane protein TerC
MNEFFLHLLSIESLISLLSLTLMEIVLGIDNIVFISILANKLPEKARKRATNIGLLVAIIPRVALLFVISWIVSLTTPLFYVDFNIIHFHPSGKDLILLLGGLFLLYKSTIEIHHKLQGAEEEVGEASNESFALVILQISLLNIVFSFDSILTAIGLVNAEEPKNIIIMILAVIFSMLIMILFANAVNEFVSKNPTIKMLALTFLLMIGMVLVMEGMGNEIPKTYIYFSMAFAIIVELLNMRVSKKAQAVRLRMRYKKDIDDDEAAHSHNTENPERKKISPKEFVKVDTIKKK